MDGLDPGTAVLFGLVVLIGLNQVVVRVEALATRAVLAGLALVNATAGGAVMAYGLPGYGSVPAVRWVVGLLLCFHAVDLMRRQRQGAVVAAAEAERQAKQRALAEKLTD